MNVELLLSGILSFGYERGVKILQRYLKIYKLPLGKTGPNRDGVDGIFGPKTASAAQKQLGKTVFQKADIDAMKKTLQTLKT